MTIAPNQQGFVFNDASIRMNAPAQSGVYALYRADAWVYIGESENIRKRLLEHLNGVGDNAGILAARPTGFAFELWPAHQRVARQDALIAELRPIANRT
jgi:predicted GIY-YIG superfamily endonuclease